MARVPTLMRDRETANNEGVVAIGPGSELTNGPEMRERADHLVRYFREMSDLPQRIQGLAMLLTTRHMDCQYIWFDDSARGIP